MYQVSICDKIIGLVLGGTKKQYFNMRSNNAGKSLDGMASPYKFAIEKVRR